jgi:hypothetical protein
MITRMACLVVILTADTSDSLPFPFLFKGIRSQSSRLSAVWLFAWVQLMRHESADVRVRKSRYLLFHKDFMNAHNSMVANLYLTQRAMAADEAQILPALRDLSRSKVAHIRVRVDQPFQEGEELILIVYVLFVTVCCVTHLRYSDER